ncbi:MAG: hypothetical protein P1U39_08715 [Legionellaceae bacterium]|nr:hypothetical protein [Legionellaceae bacterium]
MPKSIYYITDDENHANSEEATSANAMAGLHDVTAQPLWTTSSILGCPIHNMTKSPEIIPNESNEIILLAHTDNKRPPETIGERTPEKLADAFSVMFSNKQDRTNVTDIYLISCEAGMGSPSLAQKFARAMMKKGFSNIKIHAVAHPEGPLIGGGVEVTTRPGTADGGKVGKVGQVTGYYYATQESKAYHDYKAIGAILKSDRTSEQKTLFNQLKPDFEKLTDKQKEKLREGKINLVTDFEEMKEPHNTFTASGPQSIISTDMAITLSFLKRRKNSLLNLGGETNVTHAIDTLTQQLKQNPTITHQDIIAQFKPSETPSQELGFFVRNTLKAKRALGIDEVKICIEDYAKDLNRLLNTRNNTAFEFNITEETPLLGGSSEPQDIAGQLRKYANQRSDEWGFSWDVLYLKTFSFWLSDCVTSLAANIGMIEHPTDYLHIKHRETKVSAATKLADIIKEDHNTNVPVLTPAEMGALREGRLHAIASQVDGGLDKYLSGEQFTSPLHDGERTGNKKNN